MKLLGQGSIKPLSASGVDWIARSLWVFHLVTLKGHIMSERLLAWKKKSELGRAPQKYGNSTATQLLPTKLIAAKLRATTVDLGFFLFLHSFNFASSLVNNIPTLLLQMVRVRLPDLPNIPLPDGMEVDGYAPRTPEELLERDEHKFILYADRLRQMNILCDACQTEVLRRLVDVNMESGQLSQYLVQMGAATDSGYDIGPLIAEKPRIPFALSLAVLDDPATWWYNVRFDLIEMRKDGTFISDFWAAQFFLGVAGRYTHADFSHGRDVGDFLKRISDCYGYINPKLTVDDPLYTPAECCCQYENRDKLRDITGLHLRPRELGHEIAFTLFEYEIAERATSLAFLRGGGDKVNMSEYDKLDLAFRYFTEHWQSSEVKQVFHHSRTVLRSYLDKERRQLMVGAGEIEEPESGGKSTIHAGTCQIL